MRTAGGATPVSSHCASAGGSGASVTTPSSRVRAVYACAATYAHARRAPRASHSATHAQRAGATECTAQRTVHRRAAPSSVAASVSHAGTRTRTAPEYALPCRTDSDPA